jgi:hypothetical protein
LDASFEARLVKFDKMDASSLLKTEASCDAVATPLFTSMVACPKRSAILVSICTVPAALLEAFMLAWAALENSAIAD